MNPFELLWTGSLSNMSANYLEKKRLNLETEIEQRNSGASSAGATISFFRHREIYQSDVGGNSSGERPKSRPRAHRNDESPADHSSASCSPAELASASSAETHSERDEQIRR